MKNLTQNQLNNKNKIILNKIKILHLIKVITLKREKILINKLINSLKSKIKIMRKINDYIINMQL